MAFTKRRSTSLSVESPETLFRDFRSRSVEGLLSHQADLLRRYTSDAMELPNVVLELPTGSGKTLVGLLIAEFRRLTRNERVVYLCPTKQLVQQVIETSEPRYGIKTTAFMGKVKDYAPSDKAKYQTNQTIAVATYSALFNTNPFFDSPNLIVLDDAHAAENYIASAWSLRITRADSEQCYQGLLGLLKKVFAPDLFHRFASNDAESYDFGWVEKLPGPAFQSIAKEVEAFLDVNLKDTPLQYPWLFLHSHLHACQLYVSRAEVLIRPIIPPSMTHAPFANANQRLFMSATLGRGGDLERITGVKDFYRLPIPTGWDKQGIGRRFFLFPELSLPAEKAVDLSFEMIKQSKRALVLVPRDKDAEDWTERVSKGLGFPVFTAKDIEKTKSAFTASDKAVAILANRYDGIDLPGDECRLLIIKGLPKNTNLQENFLMSRMGASTLLQDRIRTRLIQAIGRCTRSATDFAAVCVLGDDFHDWFVIDEGRKYFHPELQGELKFGVEQSMEKSDKDFIDNLQVFLKHGEEWESVDSDIRAYRNEAKQATVPGEESLMASAKKEVEFQYALWDSNFERCVELAQDIAATLSGDPIKGYRGFWNYLGGYAADCQANLRNEQVYKDKANQLFANASIIAPGVSWIRLLKKKSDGINPIAEAGDELLECNVEAIEMIFDAKGYSSSRKFEKDVKQIIDGLAGIDSTNFEESQRRLGELLGFSAGNEETTAAPDPWWISAGKVCIVFEDKTDAKPENPIAVRHVRQAVSHPQWIRKNREIDDSCKIYPVIVSIAKTVSASALTYADGLSYWHIDSFRMWAQKCIEVLRTIRSEYTGTGNLAWRAATRDRLKAAGLDPKSIITTATQTSLNSITKVADTPSED